MLDNGVFMIVIITKTYGTSLSLRNYGVPKIFFA